MTPSANPLDAAFEALEATASARQHIGPKHLLAPGPDAATLQRLFHLAATAPDHEQLRPWRFVVLGEAARDTLAQAFAEALLERDATATPQQLDEAQGKAYRGPCLIMAIADLSTPHAAVPDAEKLLSLGCAVQNLLLGAQALGFGTGLTSGKALGSQALRRAFDLTEGEVAVCFISIGTPTKARARKARPAPDDFVTWR